MAKLKLGAPPKTFKHKLRVSLLNGSEADIEMTYKYRTRTEFGKFLDELFDSAKVTVKDQSDDEVTLSLAEALMKTKETNADYIMAIAEGWNVIDEDEKPVEFSRDNVARLCDELPGVALAIINLYRTAVTEGRTGN